MIKRMKINMRKNKNKKKKEKSIIKTGSCNVRTLACRKSMKKQNAVADAEFKVPFWLVNVLLLELMYYVCRRQNSKARVEYVGMVIHWFILGILQ